MQCENYVTYKLQYPINLGSDNADKPEITELKLAKRLKGKHLELLPESFFEKEGEDIVPADLIPFIGAIASISAEIASELDFADIEAIAAEIESFFIASPKTGKL